MFKPTVLRFGREYYKQYVIQSNQSIKPKKQNKPRTSTQNILIYNPLYRSCSKDDVKLISQPDYGYDHDLMANPYLHDTFSQ